MIRIYCLLVMLALASIACEVELVTPTPTATAQLKMPTPSETASEDLSEVLATNTESQQSPSSDIVSVTFGMVNLRDKNHASTGTFVKAGQMLAVNCGSDGYCEILDGEHAGLYIWQGCTSNPNIYGCQAK